MQKKLTLELVIEIIANTPPHNHENDIVREYLPVKDIPSYDDMVLAQIQRYIESGYIVTPKAQAEIDKLRNNVPMLFKEAAE